MLLYVINVIQSHYSVTEPERTNERYELTPTLVSCPGLGHFKQ